MTQFINRLREDRINVVPNLQSSGHISGLSYEFESKAMRASALGKAYTLNGLEKRGLKYDPIGESQTVAEASERSRVRREQVQGPAGRSTGESRLATNSTQPSSDAGADASPDRPSIRERNDQEEIRDRCVRSAPREEDGEVGARDAKRFYRDWQADGRNGSPPSPREQSPAQASDSYAGGSAPRADQTFGCETIVDERFSESIATPTINPHTVSFGAISLDRGEGASHNALHSDDNVGLPRTTAGGSGGRELGRVASTIPLVDSGSSGGIPVNSVSNFDYPSNAEPADLLAGFRDGLIAAIKNVDEYMQSYQQEFREQLSAHTIEAGQSSGVAVEVEPEADATILDIFGI